MKKIVWTFGLIAGGILSVVMLATVPFMDRIGDHGALIGYTTMVIAFLMVFYGIRSYRDNVAEGGLTFGRAFKVGSLIALIASLCYVLTWEVIYYTIAPDFVEKYAASVVRKERASGANEAAIAAKQAEMKKFAELYHNPLYNAAMTLLEVLPIGLIVTAVSAGILRQKSTLA